MKEKNFKNKYNKHNKERKRKMKYQEKFARRTKKSWRRNKEVR